VLGFVDQASRASAAVRGTVRVRAAVGVGTSVAVTAAQRVGGLVDDAAGAARVTAVRVCPCVAVAPVGVSTSVSAAQRVGGRIDDAAGATRVTAVRVCPCVSVATAQGSLRLVDEVVHGELGGGVKNLHTAALVSMVSF